MKFILNSLLNLGDGNFSINMLFYTALQTVIIIVQNTKVSSGKTYQVNYLKGRKTILKGVAFTHNKESS